MAEVRVDLHDADGRLPDVCACCGEVSEVTKSKNMTWCPPWVGVLVLAGLLPYIVIASIMTKRAKVQIPLCEEHQGHWFNRHLIVWGTFAIFGLAIGAMLIFLMVLPQHHQDNLGPFICIGCFGLGVIWLIILAVAQSTAIRPKEITDEDIVLQGVADEFVTAVDDMQRERRKRKRKRRDDWDDEEEEAEPRPRKKKRPPSDAFEE